MDYSLFPRLLYEWMYRYIHTYTRQSKEQIIYVCTSTIRVISGKAASKPNEGKVEGERQWWRLDWLRSKKLTRPCLPTDAMERTDERAAIHYRCCTYRESETFFFPDPAGTRELRYPRRYALRARDFFCVSHSDRVVHRVEFCLPSFPWSMYNAARVYCPLSFGDFPVRGRFTASVLYVIRIV